MEIFQRTVGWCETADTYAEPALEHSMKVDVVSGVNGKERRQAILACLNKGGTADVDWSLVRKLAGDFLVFY